MSLWAAGCGRHVLPVSPGDASADDGLQVETVGDVPDRPDTGAADAPGAGAADAGGVDGGPEGGDSGASPDAPDVAPPPPPVLGSLSLDPTSLTLLPGSSAAVRLFGHYSDGSVAELTGMASWSVAGDPGVISYEDQRVHALAVGAATVTAGYGRVQASMNVTVAVLPIAGIMLIGSPNAMVGSTLIFQAFATLSDGSTLEVTDGTTWTSSDTTVADFTAPGRGTAFALGETIITAAYGGRSAVLALTVSMGYLASIAIGPPSALATPLEVADTVALYAEGTFTDGTKRDITQEVDWSSFVPGPPDVPKTPFVVLSDAIGAKGIVTGIRSGTAEITASQYGISATVTVTIYGGTLESITISPTDATVTVGSTEHFTATGLYSEVGARDLTAAVYWISDHPEIADFDDRPGFAGTLATSGTGRTLVDAEIGAVGTVTFLYVIAPPLSLALSPLDVSTPLGVPVQYTAIATLADGTQRDVTDEAEWIGEGVSVASVDAMGHAVPLSVGVATITADYQGIEASTTLTVTPAISEFVRAEPANP
jgi:hypothetical protein